MEQQVENGFNVLKETVSKFIKQSAYTIVNLTELFSGISKQKQVVHNVEIKKEIADNTEEQEEDSDL